MRIDFGTLIGVTLFAACLLPAEALASSASPSAAARFGAPPLCFPLDIGEAASLPWSGRDAFAPSAGYDIARTADDTLAILAASDDALVHVETLRRAIVYLAGEGLTAAARRASPYDAAWRENALAALWSRLEAALPKEPAAGAPAHSTHVLPALAPGGEACRLAHERRQALALLGAGYVLAALEQVGHPRGVAAAPLLERAAALAGDDGALRLGLALAGFGGSERRFALEQLDRALALAQDAKGLLRKNLVAVGERMFRANGYDSLVRAVRAEIARG